MESSNNIVANKSNSSGPCITIKKSTLEKFCKNILVYYYSFM